MNTRNVADAGGWFRVLQTGERTQTAVMDLAPGEESGEKANEHPDSEQVLYVVDGEIVAEIGEETRTMRAGDVVIVPRGTPHRFSNLADRPARTLNIYGPPAY
jgi:mannose-6-phosphate isomerase-like protein (cupin superfamily)